MNAMHPLLDIGVAAARAAARVIQEAAQSPAALEIRQKQPNDFVTQVDLASEKIIVATLLNACPGHAVRSEESIHAHGAPGADHVWIVDPLDGTSNFIHGYPAYAVSLALSIRGRIEHGVVLDAVNGDVFHASLGTGAWRNGERLHVANRPGLEGALLGTSCPYRPGPAFAPSMAMLSQVMLRVAGIRRSGCAALDLAWTAAGRTDGCFDLGLNAWDVAAGSLLVTEAGGQVGNFRGEPDFLETRECLAANPAVFAALTDVLRPFAAPRTS
jgi:myo-inositol-1(or 4)-monophosphatase